MPERYDNTIYKLSFGIKKTIKAILSSIIKIELIVYIEDPEEAFGVDYVYIEEDTEVEETTVVDIVTTTYSVRSDAMSVINLDAS
jgi:ribosomal protein L7Ae-like RNA K-turn-binding protein